MIYYETLILAVPEITSGETSDLETFFENTIKRAGASLVSFEKWGKYRLAYPVTKRDYGVYFLTRYTVEDGNSKVLMDELQMLFTVKLPQSVMRFMTTRLDGRKSLEYKKPESLEDIPAQDVDKLLRDKSRLLDKSSGRTKTVKESTGSSAEAKVETQETLVDKSAELEGVAHE